MRAAMRRRMKMWAMIVRERRKPSCAPMRREISRRCVEAMCWSSTNLGTKGRKRVEMVPSKENKA